MKNVYLYVYLFYLFIWALLCVYIKWFSTKIEIENEIAIKLSAGIMVPFLKMCVLSALEWKGIKQW